MFRGIDNGGPSESMCVSLGADSAKAIAAYEAFVRQYRNQFQNMSLEKGEDGEFRLSIFFAKRNEERRRTMRIILDTIDEIFPQGNNLTEEAA